KSIICHANLQIVLETFSHAQPASKYSLSNGAETALTESPADGSKRSGLRSRSKDVEIVLRNGRVLRIAADADLELLSALIACVEAA
ncbi:hypothetical protein, partial [Sinorhizobium meliloti]|uniref:hypothetical protein n=1 Tax=Rhizobium meliloti TaxID=382 RepID=UPI001A9CBA0E